MERNTRLTGAFIIGSYQLSPRNGSEKYLIIRINWENHII